MMNRNVISSNRIQGTIDSEYTMNLDLLRDMVEVRWLECEVDGNYQDPEPLCLLKSLLY